VNSDELRKWVHDTTKETVWRDGLDGVHFDGNNIDTGDELTDWWGCSEKKRNQESLAKLFARAYSDKLCYSYELNQWLEYNGKYWAIDLSDGRSALAACINSLIAIITSEDVPEFTGRNVEEQFEKWQKNHDNWLGWMVKQNNALNQNGILTNARSFAYVPLRKFDANQWLLNCNNGTIDLKTGELHDFDPNDRLTNYID
jgi:putative DNA primase/helicase